jgi:cyclophilin family peptidyl-prolyl cis-trans isomerase
MLKHIIISLLIVAVVGGGIFFLIRGDNESGNEDNVVVSSVDSPNEVNEVKEMIAIVKTNYGEIEIDLSEADAPNTVANFVKLAQDGFYNGTKFHRVIVGFMVQGGDPLSKDDSQMANWGTGGPGYAFADEIHSNNQNLIGTISMANSGPNTNGSQFFINVADNNFLDQKHTVFGKVIKGMDVISTIEKVETGNQDVPVNPVVVESITIK